MKLYRFFIVVLMSVMLIPSMVCAMDMQVMIDTPPCHEQDAPDLDDLMLSVDCMKTDMAPAKFFSDMPDIAGALLVSYYPLNTAVFNAPLRSFAFHYDDTGGRKTILRTQRFLN